MGQRETKEPIMSSQLLAFLSGTQVQKPRSYWERGSRAQKSGIRIGGGLARQLPREETRERGSQLAFLSPFSGPLFGEAGLARVFSF